MNRLARVATLGTIAGMRSMSAPAFLANHLRRVDKLPIVSSRIEVGPLAGRVVVGAVCGSLYRRALNESAASGAVVGAVAAALSAFAFWALRCEVVSREYMSDKVAGVLEDALVIALGSSIVLPRRD